MPRFPKTIYRRNGIDNIDMDKWAILERLSALLSKTGFYVSKIHHIKSISFDIVARRDDTLLIIKALQNVDALAYRDAEEMRLLADVLDGSPLVISEKSSSSDLEDGVVYSRMGIPVITYPTIEDFLESGNAPLIFAAPGGFYVRIDGNLLREVREERGLSLGEIASAAGVSRRTVKMYEEGMSMEVEAAINLEEALGVPLILPMDLFSPSRYEAKEREAEFDRRYGEIFEFLDQMGYRVFPTVKCPFDALTEMEKDVLLTNVGDYTRTLVKKAEIVREVSDIAEQNAVIFVRREIRKKDISGVPVITFKELMNSSLEDLMELLMERKRE